MPYITMEGLLEGLTHKHGLNDGELTKITTSSKGVIKFEQ